MKIVILLKASESFNCINMEETAAKACILYTTAINFDHFENSKKVVGFANTVLLFPILYLQWCRPKLIARVAQLKMAISCYCFYFYCKLNVQNRSEMVACPVNDSYPVCGNLFHHPALSFLQFIS